MELKQILFDEDDRTLFLIDDIQLKADAIRYSILPKLEIVNNELISRLIKVYNFDFFQNYSVAKTPHFRISKTQRKEPTKTNYSYSGISITGQRKENKWFGLDRGNKIIPSISPTNLSIDLTNKGLSTHLFFNHPKNFTIETYQKFYTFFIDNIEIISGLASKANFQYQFKYFNIFSIKRDLELRFESGDYDIIFSTRPFEYPINYKKINDLIFSNIIFFPVINACINIALGEQPKLEENITKIEANLFDYVKTYFGEQEAKAKKVSIENADNYKQKAEGKVKVQAGLRWQVFQRDNWRCLSCGRGVEDNIILHVDHILPRSKGGKDEFDNYQTLCDICNIGKSNKNQTDLRII